MKKVIILCLIIISLFVFCSCTPSLTLEEEYELLISDKTPIDPFQVTFVYDITKLEKVIGFSDYVFVGKVTGYLGTINDTPSGIPETLYSVSVLENIKGNLITNKNIELLKDGGLSENRKRKSMLVGDTMPKIGDYYIFLVFASKDGEIKATHGKTVNKIENIRDFYEDDEYKKVLQAYENEEVFDRVRYKSIYEQG